jgi:hypothetical protein
MITRDFGLALAFALFGFFFTAHQYPEMHLIQIVFPLCCGIAAGIVLGRGIWHQRVVGKTD